MKKIPLILACAAIASLLSASCKKNNNSNTTPANGCRLMEEGSVGGPGYQGDWWYEYDDKNVIKRAYMKVNGQETGAQAVVQGNGVKIIRSPTFYLDLTYSGLVNFMPVDLDISLTEQPTTIVHWDKYYFKYDQAGRLIQFQNDAQSITVTYDNNGNVVKMENYLFTAPRVKVNVLTVVEGYDDKPSPYTGQPIYKFLQHNFDYSYYDEEQFIAALSKNNPGKITTSYYDTTTNGFNHAFIKKMTYTYYDSGMPHTCVVSDISSGSGQPYSNRSYGYAGCN